MKKKQLKAKFGTQFMLVVFLAFCISDRMKGKEPTTISIGIGIPELYNIGFRIQSKQTQLGFSAGAGSKSGFSLSGDLFYHFGGLSKFTDLRPWYGRTDITFIRSENEYDIVKYGYITLRFGREFSFLKNIGVSFDAGIGVQIFHDDIVKKLSTGFLDLDIQLPVIPAAGVCFFYRF